MAHYKPTLPKVTLIYHVTLNSLISFQPLEVITATKPHNRDQRGQALDRSHFQPPLATPENRLRAHYHDAVGH
jgi:hypothetical protein